MLSKQKMMSPVFITTTIYSQMHQEAVKGCRLSKNDAVTHFLEGCDE